MVVAAVELEAGAGQNGMQGAFFLNKALSIRVFLYDGAASGGNLLAVIVSSREFAPSQAAR
ncbi:hypothetical protein H9L05_15905 [Hymenobacter qilianensis]|uniref:Uncharacterized protein n=1 Tax=Hymenobacter qilianensis TaxID=1385715 RepID=A0A7H0GT72_9BACT|nr:hypothetical protein [Hymenobacter qilianensis]QNP51488.1 hypothetical protein H9L05_15905 [Hymenobacter qilianensis]